MSIIKKISLSLLLTLFVFGTSELSAQRPGRRMPQAQQSQENPVADSTKKSPEKSPEKGPVSLEKFIKPGTMVMNGFTSVYKQDGKYFININDSIIGRDILMVTRISKAAEGIRTDFAGYAGDEVNSGVLRFEKGPNNKIFLTNVIGRERVKDSTSAMYESVRRSSLNAIIASFDIKALSEDKGDRLIDVTDLFNADSETLFFRKSGKTALKLGALVRDASYILAINTYPINTEVKSVKTYSRPDGGNATYELNNSLVLLPKVPMTPRYEDERVGYFTENYTDYSYDPQGVKKISMISRFRLEPKPEDMEKYKRGELVEPVKPIIFYIDPATPKEWVPYLIQGVNDWQVAFEKAGFKNAIYALEAPTKDQDSTWSLEDARYCAIVYKPSETPNASGPHISDPRSGEIIESHVNWYHNVMFLLRNWYMVQCSPVDPGARKMKFDNELMGQLIRFVSSHELGHTLGLRHNFAGTALYTAEQLRDTAFLRENGHTTSIMDYSRFNYVAQPEDNIPRDLLFPGIGHYDLWAIEWGYRRFPDINDPVAELPRINSWIIEKTKDEKFKFGTESSASDPRFQAEDLGENQMIANELGIKNLKYVMAHLGEWTKEPNTDYENLKTMHSEVNKQFIRYIGHVAKWVGGIYQDSKKVEEPGDVFTFVEKERQQEAMDFLNRNLFENAPRWLVPAEYVNKFVNRPEFFMEKAYSAALSSLLSKRVMLNLTAAERTLGDKAYTVKDLFKSLDKVVWAKKITTSDDRILQKLYVTSLCDLFTGASSSSLLSAIKQPTANPKDITESSSLAYYQIQKTLKYLKGKKTGDFNTDAHYAYLVRYIENTLSATK